MSHCNRWELSGGFINHDSGRFFSVCGLRSSSAGGFVALLQPEVGVLGLLTAECDGVRHWLLQDKAEPGNIRGFQWAPTVQATRSNYERVHGGAETPFLGKFLASVPVLADVEQSEQGTAFVGKFNRNITIVSEDVCASPPGFRWVTNRQLKRLLLRDHCVNTDARSVVASTPLDAFVDRGEIPFSRSGLPDPLREALTRSVVELDHGRVTAALRELVERYNPHGEWVVCPLHDVDGHRIDARGIVNHSGDRVLGCFDVSLPTREVTAWRQPLLIRTAIQVNDLGFRTIGGVAKFRVVAREEPGFLGRAEFGPDTSYLGGAANSGRVAAEFGSSVIASVRQSDEGGRFFRFRSEYRIRALAGTALPAHGRAHWLTLAELSELSRTRGVLTNELRSCLSLLVGLI
jgi:dTDP-4-dehydro-6-deoxy-alpha-D-glucopyranose 2,3-dehydratase